MIEEKIIKPYFPYVPLIDERGVYNYMGGRMTYGLIRHLCVDTCGPYLEVGSYRGVSLLAAGDGTGVKCTGIDNFSGVAARLADDHRTALLANIAGHENIRLIEKDFRNVRSRKKYAVIFLDGPHDYEGTRAQIEYAKKRLKPGGYIILDDANSEEVRQAANDCLSGYELVFEKYTEPDRGKGYSTDSDWWNGTQVWRK